jgi:hypothetical protein
MRNPRYNWFAHASASLLTLALFGCGETNVDLGEQSNTNGSPLRLSQPANELTLLWDAVEDVTEFRVRQTDTGPELILGKELITDQTILTIDVSAFGPSALGAAEFAVAANIPEDGWTNVEFVQRGQLAPREFQFDWDPVEGANQYRLTQTAGRYPLLPLPQQQAIYPPEQVFARFMVPLHLFDWDNSRFTLEAQVAGEWVLIGERETDDVITERLIDRYAEVDPFVAQVGSQLAYGWSVALSENSETLAIGALGETSVPVDQRVCPEDEPDCDPDDLFVVARNSGAVYAYAPLDADAKLLKAPNTDSEDLFGRDVALSDDGTTLVVSALTEDSDLTGIFPVFDSLTDNEDASNSGAAYVFIRAGEEWVLQAYIKAPNAAEDDLFGWDIALSGDGSILAISALFEDASGADPQDNSLSNSGAVFVYTRADNIWTQQAYLKASNADENDAFGTALAINQDGNYLAVSALGEAGSSGQPDDNGRPASGAVYLFARDSANAWSQVAYLKASNAESGDLFGQSLSFDASASLLVVGAPREDKLIAGVVPVNSGSESLNTGAAYLFARSGAGVNSTWNQKSFYFKPSNASQNQQFGQAVALSSSGNTLAVGAWGERSVAVGIGGNQDGENVQGAGATYVFSRIPDSDSWEQTNYVKASDQLSNLFFGSKLALADDGRLMGVAGNGVRPDSFITGFSGYVYLY